MEEEISFFFILATSKRPAVNIYEKDNFDSGSRSQIISTPPSLAPQLCFIQNFLRCANILYSKKSLLKNKMFLCEIFYIFSKIDDITE